MQPLKTKNCILLDRIFLTENLNFPFNSYSARKTNNEEHDADDWASCNNSSKVPSSAGSNVFAKKCTDLEWVSKWESAGGGQKVNLTDSLIFLPGTRLGQWRRCII